MITLLWILIIQSVRVCVRALTSMSSVKLCSQRTQQHLNRPSLTPCSGSDRWTRPPRLKLKLRSNLHCHYLRYKSRNLSVKKNFQKTNNWIRQVVDLPGWGWSWVLIYTSPTSSHLLHSQQKQKVNNFLVKTRSSWLPAGSRLADYEIGSTWIIGYFPFYFKYEIEFDLQRVCDLKSGCTYLFGKQFTTYFRNVGIYWVVEIVGLNAPPLSILVKTLIWFHP